MTVPRLRNPLSCARKGFGIVVSGVKDAVCENLLKETDGTNVYIANDDETLSEVACSGDNNEFLFVSVYIDLNDVGLVYYYWTGDSFDSNSAWFVRVYNKSFLSNIRYDGAHAYSALCE